MVEGLMAAGMDVARLNFSHGDYDQHARMVKLVRSAAERAGREIAILQDLSGPKIRIGDIKGSEDGREIRPGDPVVLTVSDDADGVRTLWVNYPRLPLEVAPGERILLSDATLELSVDEVEGDRVSCRVV